MAIRVVQLGSRRSKGEGLRIGTVRRPPRGVPKADYATRDYYDVWLPQIAPGAALISRLKKGPDTAANWNLFRKGYLRELSLPDNARLLDTLAALSREADFSIGCYCENESRCHRSILREVLARRGAAVR